MVRISNLPLTSYVRNHLHEWPLLRTLVVLSLYPVERQLIRGEHAARSSKTSIIHFSINKCATQYVKNLLSLCAMENNIVTVQFNQYAFLTNIEFLDRMAADEFGKYKHIFRLSGYCYTVFGGMVHGIPDLDAYRKILMVRDPRDVLTSQYYSTAFSHPLPGDPEKAQAFMTKRRLVQQMSIDEYALSASDRLFAILEDYLKTLKGRPGVHLTRYEDMIANFPGWLDALLSFCSMEIAEKTRRKLIDKSAATVPSRQRPDRKRRQVMPGDHRRKLKPETIEALNHRFASILGPLGYSVL